MALQIVTVADSISKLLVTGVELKDIDKIVTEGHKRNIPMIIPRPDGFISGFLYERESFGPGSTAAINISYTLTYRLLHSKIGTGRSGVIDKYSDMVAKVGLFLDAIIANDTITGAVDIQPFGISEFGPVSDPAGSAVFLGCDIGINVMEFVN